jgi:rubrerythrin
MTIRFVATALAVSAGMLAAVGTIPARGEEGMSLASLRIAYQREVDARQQYIAYAGRAEREGYPGVRDLFLVLSRCEEVHAHLHATLLDKMDVKPVAKPTRIVVNATTQNLLDAFYNELYERKVVYDRFMEHARTECLYDIVAGLRYASDAEASHARALAGAYFHLPEMQQARAFTMCMDCGGLRCELSPNGCGCGSSGDRLVTIVGKPIETPATGPLATAP